MYQDGVCSTSQWVQLASGVAMTAAGEDRRRNEVRVGTVTLREVVEGDISIFFRHQSDPVAAQMAQVAARDEAAYVARWTRLLADTTVATKTVLVDGTVAGHVVSFNGDGLRELGYWLGREFWGQGITSAAVHQYLAVERQRPLFAIVAEHNVASRRILKRHGFRESSAKDHVLHYRLSGV
jgi:RimJ/RimL family protein N-acetyltransferase